MDFTSKPKGAEPFSEVDEAQAPGVVRSGVYDETIGGGTFGDPANDPPQAKVDAAQAGLDPELERYEVGYGKPPKHSQFQPGRSGNPTGRRRRPESFSTHMDQALKRLRRVEMGGQVVELTVQEVLAHRLLEKALAGDMRAFDRVQLYLDRPPEEPKPERGGRMVTMEITEEELDLIEKIAEEHGKYYDEDGRQLNGARREGEG